MIARFFSSAATLQQDRIWYSRESRSGCASLVSDWFELAEQLDALGTALARKDNIVDRSEIVQATWGDCGSMSVCARAIGKGAVVMLNSNQGWMLRGEITAAIGREYGWPALKDIPEISNVLPDVAYAGTYESVNGNRLLVEFAHRQALPVYPAAAGEFIARAINLRKSD
ncbi:MAG TPA: hypothetical protein VHQ48_05895 [Bradyrhizobium sp.]|nr:hypothetical protein [Bradyrhizobium sp.]